MSSSCASHFSSAFQLRQRWDRRKNYFKWVGNAPGNEDFNQKPGKLWKKKHENSNKQRTTILDIWGIPIKCRSFTKLDSDQTSSLIARGQWRNSHKTNLQNRNSQALIQEMETSAPVDLSGHWLEHLGTQILPTLILSSQYEMSGILVRSAW